jgi:hypothetical protein
MHGPQLEAPTGRQVKSPTLGTCPHYSFCIWGLTTAAISYMVPNWRHLQVTGQVPNCRHLSLLFILHLGPHNNCHLIPGPQLEALQVTGQVPNCRHLSPLFILHLGPHNCSHLIHGPQMEAPLGTEDKSPTVGTCPNYSFCTWGLTTAAISYMVPNWRHLQVTGQVPNCRTPSGNRSSPEL